ncbi:MAG: hypothetical protein AAFN30_15675, partial [Actinomycetota bacterium]
MESTPDGRQPLDDARSHPQDSLLPSHRWVLHTCLMRLRRWVWGCTVVFLVAGGCARAPLATETGPASTSREPTTVATTAGSVEEQSPTTSAMNWVPVERPASMTGRTTIDWELRVERLPEFSDVAVRGQIVRLGPADYLVPEAVLAELNGSRAVLARETSAPISTPIVVRVHEVLAARPAAPVGVAVGDELVVWVSGGSVEFTVTPEDAARTGLRPDISHEEEQAIIDSGQEPPEEPGPVPGEPFQFGYSAPEFISLTEGQEVVAFVRWADWYDPVANDGTYYDDLTLLLGLDYTGVGLFVR